MAREKGGRPKGRPQSGAPTTGGKTPVAGQAATGSKLLRASSTPHDGTTIVWRFSRMDFDGRWGWGRLEASEIEAIHAKCANWEKMRSNEVFGQGGNKRIPLEGLDPDAQALFAKSKPTT